MMDETEKKLYQMAIVIEEQQKTLDASLKKIDVAVAALAQERAELAKTVENISKEVGKSAAQSLINALGEAQVRFNHEMNKTANLALKSAQDTNKELEIAKKNVATFTRGLEGTLSAEMNRAATKYFTMFAVLGVLLFGGLYAYGAYLAYEELQSAAFWKDQSDAAYEKCFKTKGCIKK